MKFASNQLSGSVPTQLTSISFPAGSATWTSNCIVNCSSLLTGCDLVERSALTDFYIATSGPYWTVNSGWMTSTHPCTWYGVKCSGGSTTSGPVVDISITGTLSTPSGLVGSLPSTVSQLTALTYAVVR